VAAFSLREPPDVATQRASLEASDRKKWQKVNKALRFLASDPSHNGLQAHKWDSLKGTGPNGEDIWTAYVENHTPSAWRIFYYYPKNERGVIALLSIEPHS
jgi:hypothetical protein